MGTAPCRMKNAAEAGGEDQMRKMNGSEIKARTASEMAIVMRDVFDMYITLLPFIYSHARSNA